MQFGFFAPVNGPLSGPRDLARIVGAREAIGYNYCTIGDMLRLHAEGGIVGVPLRRAVDLL